MEQRIVFIKDILLEAKGSNPQLQFAIKGDFGTIKEQINISDTAYLVYWDGWKGISFRAEIDKDFIIVNKIPPDLALLRACWSTAIGVGHRHFPSLTKMQTEFDIWLMENNICK